MSPTPTHGKICYLDLPAVNVGQSADFYARLFGWSIRRRDNGAVAFDDTDAPAPTARFGDPAGNFIGLYQDPVGRHR